MRIEPVEVRGAWLIRIDRIEDERGFFARTWCDEAFARALDAANPTALDATSGKEAANPVNAGRATNLASAPPARFVQQSVSFNRRRGTLRGLHYQTAPSQEGKLVRCTAGAIWDVIVDLRPDSPTYLRHAAVELTSDNRDALYIPPGLAHGFQTLSDDTEVFYQMTDTYQPELARGVRWNDPAFGIRWPGVGGAGERVIHPRDAGYPDFDPATIQSLRRQTS